MLDSFQTEGTMNHRMMGLYFLLLSYNSNTAERKEGKNIFHIILHDKYTLKKLSGYEPRNIYI